MAPQDASLGILSKDGAMTRIQCWRISRLASFLVLVLLVTLAGQGMARQDTVTTVRDWNNYDDAILSGIGLHFGEIGGEGLAFRVPLKWWLYLQVAGGIWHTGGDRKHNLGANLNYILRQDQRLRLYVSGGTAFFYHRTSKVVDQDWNLGAGVGVEYLQGPRWAWKVEADFAYLGRNGDIKVVPQAGVTYYW